MAHVILREFYVERETPYFADYAKPLHRPALPRAARRSAATPTWPAPSCTAADLGDDGENADAKTVVWDTAAGAPVVPNGSIGFRWGEEGAGRWNLDLEGVDPAPSRCSTHRASAWPSTCRASTSARPRAAGSMRRGVPVAPHRRPPGHDRLRPAGRAARRGPRRPAGRLARRLDDAEPYTPGLAGGDHRRRRRAGHPHRARVRPQRRAHQRPLDDRDGRGHQPLVPLRPDLPGDAQHGRALRLPGRQRRRLGALRRPGEGAADHRLLAGGLRARLEPARRATRPRPRSGTWPPSSTATRPSRPTSSRRPLGDGILEGAHFADLYAKAARMGWLPAYPSFDRNPLDLAAAAEAEGIAAGRLRGARAEGRHACASRPRTPARPENFPRVLTLWRSNLFGSSSKGHEYFLKHLLGVTTSAVRSEESPPELRPKEVVWRDEAAEAQARPAGHARLPHERLVPALGRRAAGGHLVREARHLEHRPAPVRARLLRRPSGRPGRRAPTGTSSCGWPSRSRALAERHLGVRTDLVAAPLLHDTPDELAQIGAPVRDWKLGECEPIPGQTMPKLIPVVRDYPALHAQMTAPRPAGRDAPAPPGRASRGRPTREVRGARRCATARVRGGPADGRPRMERAEQACETILALSGTTNGAPGGRGLPGAGEAHRQRARRPRRGARRRAASPTRTPRSSRAR